MKYLLEWIERNTELVLILAMFGLMIAIPMLAHFFPIEGC